MIFELETQSKSTGNFPQENLSNYQRLLLHELHSIRKISQK
jgi:hypothetical protein